ncbi:hypothetical protein A2995_01810 [Candidatus Nomurabacteria bacterium RIFCSPLOWO2_01_FULL_33_24]|uniref:Uncharacterized protein n=1 Tax=Candidatus Nomurabacteria bacterium RIFCSPLOWO2_01_FULL_33_24 TaxID=1801765 RepID=A0A1F6X1S7_9BACT|nr:MAG: hypothetical protein A2995_01810 [Candidatus Nomurabacteria bacterium RIFCSPLOWO2_01_FULL_33_24]
MFPFLNKTKNRPFKDINNLEIHPRRDWNTFIKIFFVLIVLMIIFNLYLFSQINREEIFQISEDNITKGKTIDRKNLEEILNYFDKKDQKFNEILKSNFDQITPSNEFPIQ